MRKTLAVLLAAILPITASAEDLMQVYRDALAYDAQFAAARAQLEATQERIPQAKAGLLPTIGLSSYQNWNDVRPAGGSPRGYDSYAYSLDLRQPLFRMQNWLTYDQSKLQVTQAEALFAQVRQDLILRATQAYFDVLLAQDTVGVLGSLKKAVAEQLEQAKRSFEVGTATITDTYEAQSRHDLVVAQEIAAQNDLEVKRQALRQITGKVPDALFGLRPDVKMTRPDPDNIDRWVESAETNAFAVVAQQAGLEIAGLETRKATAGHYPTVDVVASYAHAYSGGPVSTIGGTSVVGSTTDTGILGIQLALPLYAGGGVMSRERETLALKDKARQELENARRTSALSARQAYLGATSGLAQVQALQQALVSSQSALEASKLGYEVGIRINIDVLNAEQQVAATRRDLLKARYDTLLAQLRLRAAAAGLGEEDVQSVNGLLAR